MIFGNNFTINEYDLEHMVYLCQKYNWTPYKALKYTSNRWEDVFDWAVELVSEDVEKEVKKRLKNKKL